jgi:hypothetical protein
MLRKRTLLVALAVALVAAAGFSALWAQGELHGWVALGPAHALTLTRVEEAGESTVFSFTNISARTVTAYALTISSDPDDGSGDLYGECIAALERFCWPPGATETVHQATRLLPATHTWQVRAVVFDDGSGEGAQKELDDIRYHRAGIMIEGERLNRILGAANPSDVSDAAIGALRVKIGGPPASPDAALISVSDVDLPGLVLDRAKMKDNRIAFHFLAGVNAARSVALGELDALVRKPAEPAAAGGPSARAVMFSEISQKHRDKGLRYRGYCEQMRERGINQ